MRVTHLNGLKALEACLRTGSFGNAATELGVTTAAVGQQIRTLEDFLDCRLFVRTSSGAQPTEQAREVERKLTQSFSTIDGVINQLKHRQTGNRLAVTLPSSFAENWFAGRLPDFYRLNSEIDLRLDASNRMVDLLTEDFDFAIRYDRPSSDVYDEQQLFGDFVLPVCTPEFANRHRLSGNQNSLEGVPLIHLGERTPDPQWADWMAWGEAFGFHPDTLQSGMLLTEFNSGIQTAIRGQGLVLCGITEAYNAIKEGTLVIPFGAQRSLPTSYKYRLVSVRARKLSSLQNQFKDWVIRIAEEFRQEVNGFLSTS